MKSRMTDDLTVHPFPDQRAIEAVCEVATTSEAATDLVKKMNSRIARLPTAERERSELVRVEIGKYAELVRAQSTNRSAYWTGKPSDAPVNSLIQYQKTLSAEAFKKLSETVAGEPIEFNFAINPKTSELLQGFSYEDGRAMDDEATEQINHIYQDWLLSNKYFCEDGVIYVSEEDGSDKVDPKTGERVRVEADEYQKLFLGEESNSVRQRHQGFSSFVKQTTKGAVEVKVNDLSAIQFPAEVQAESSRGGRGT
jgi:hypothetical protein